MATGSTFPDTPLMPKVKQEMGSGTSNPLQGSCKPMFGFGRGKMFDSGQVSTPGGPSPVSVVIPPRKKIKKFCGDENKDYGVEDFIDEVTAAIPTLSEQESPTSFVMSHLEAAAKREVKTCGVPWTKVEDIFAILREAFGDRRALSTVLRSFTERVQGKDEGIRAYASDLFERFKALKDKQKELDRPVSDESVLCDQFSEGLREKALVWELKRMKGNVSFALLRRAALEWETVHETWKSSGKPRNKVEVSEVGSVGGGQGSPANVPAGPTPFARGQPRLGDTVNRVGCPPPMGTQSGSQPQHVCWEDRRHRPWRLRGSEHFEWTSDHRPICAGCKGIGHTRRYCEKRTPRTPSLNDNPSQ